MSVRSTRIRFSLQLTAAAALAVACGVAAAQDVKVVKLGHAGPISGGTVCAWPWTTSMPRAW